MKMNIFTKWFIINAVTLTAAYFAHQKGLIMLFVNNDASYVSLIIMIMFVCASIFNGFICKSVDERFTHESTTPKIHKNLRINKFVSDTFTMLGFLATLIGLSLMMYTNLNNYENIQAVINQLKMGSATAFYSTITGIVCTLLLNLQIFVIEINLNNEKETFHMD